MIKRIKYYFLRNYHILFTKNRVVKIVTAQSWFHPGDKITSDKGEATCLGNELFLIDKKK